MILAGFDGTTFNQETEDLILKHHVGGLILFGRNCESPEQLHRLVGDLQDAALSSS